MSDPLPDPAAIFCAATSLRKAATEAAAATHTNLAACYSGGDEFIRQCAQVAEAFERWCCLHINWDELTEVWPYLLEDRFGAVALERCGGEKALSKLHSEADWAAIAAKLGLALR